MAYCSNQLSISLPCKLEGGKLSIIIGQQQFKIPFLWCKETFPVQQWDLYDRGILVYLQNDKTKLVIREDGSCSEYTKDNYLLRSYNCNIKRIEESLTYDKLVCISYDSYGIDTTVWAHVYKVTEDIRLIIPSEYLSFYFLVTKAPDSFYFDLSESDGCYYYDAATNYLVYYTKDGRELGKLRAFMMNSGASPELIMG